MKDSDPWDFSGSPVVKNPSFNVSNSGSIPGWGTKILQAAGQLSPQARGRELMCHNC